MHKKMTGKTSTKAGLLPERISEHSVCGSYPSSI